MNKEIDDNLQVMIHNTAKVAINALIKRGSYIGSNVIICNADIGPNTVFIDCNIDETTQISDGVIIGGNSTICANVKIEQGALIKPGSVVTKSVPANAIVEGNPANIVGYTNTTYESFTIESDIIQKQIIVEKNTTTKGVSILASPVIKDIRGSLTVGNFLLDIPFKPNRYFIVYNVPSKEIRGEHAHLECEEFLICISGSCSILADDGKNKTEILLNSPNKGVYLPPMTWRVHYQYSSDAVLLVFASHLYDSNDYIRNYQDFIKEVKNRNDS
jgi:carbonic anhydrase/acetyltransferase-like protein (isoleucine patch superfamily)